MIDMNIYIERLCRHEGLRLMPYRCPQGKLTIGVGRNIEDNPFTSEELKAVGDWQHGITKNAALFLLRNDIKRVYRQCKKQIPAFKSLNSDRQYALVDMAFNLGINGLLKFKKMLNALFYGNYDLAAKECLCSEYAEQTGKRAQIISQTLRSGIFPKE